YGAYWGTDTKAPPEFENITWWDAVDLIGVDGRFPLTANVAAVPVPTLVHAWHGQKDDLDLAGQGDIVSRLKTVSDKYKHPILFPAAGYESVPGPNSKPGGTVSTNPDQVEQERDMEALLTTFSPTATPWFVGVIWAFDEPKWPRSSVDGWAFSSSWAGDTVD